jgi:hypothetical protein
MSGVGGVGAVGVLLHPARESTTAKQSPSADRTPAAGHNDPMWLLLLEALLALAILIFIVWWTMFSGRRRGEPPPALPHRPVADQETPEPGNKPPPSVQ